MVFRPSESGALRRAIDSIATLAARSLVISYMFSAIAGSRIFGSETDLEAITLCVGVAGPVFNALEFGFREIANYPRMTKFGDWTILILRTLCLVIGSIVTLSILGYAQGATVFFVGLAWMPTKWADGIADLGFAWCGRSGRLVDHHRTAIARGAAALACYWVLLFAGSDVLLALTIAGLANLAVTLVAERRRLSNVWIGGVGGHAGVSEWGLASIMSHGATISLGSILVSIRLLVIRLVTRSVAGPTALTILISLVAILRLLNVLAMVFSQLTLGAAARREVDYPSTPYVGRLVGEAWLISCLPIAALAVVTLIFGKQVLELLVGAPASEVAIVHVALIMMAGTAAGMSSGIIRPLLAIKGKGWVRFGAPAIALLLSLLAIEPAVSAYGVLGAATVSTGALVLVAAIYTLVLLRTENTRFVATNGSRGRVDLV